MRAKSSNNHTGRRGFILPTAAVLFMVAIPIVGLVIDVGVLYMVQSKLSASVDAAALAGARSLSRGNDSASQRSAAQTTALAYVAANFPTGYMGTPAPLVPTPTVVDNTPNIRTVTVNASVQVPLLFMAWFGGHATTVSAAATATRRDVNVVIVMDRSGSLQTSGSCTPLKAAAAGFSDKFAEGRDNVGLITFATSSRVDFGLANNFKTANPSVDTTISRVTCTGATSSAQAIWQGYQSLATMAQPAALNVILFFTDGDPTAVTGSFPIKATSACTSKTNKTGVFTVGFNASGVPVATGGLMDYIAGAQPIVTDMNIITAAEGGSSGCAFASSWPNNWTGAGNDLAYVPSLDIWGNSLLTNYKSVTLTAGKISSTSSAADAQNIVNACYNAADNAGLRIRQVANPNNGAGSLPGVVIFSIGLGGSGAASADFLQRVANDPNSSSFTTSAPTGLYVYSPTSADLNNAFNRVASEILRLAK